MLYPISNINIGTYPNDGQGDPLRTAFLKINTNFSNVYNFANLAYYNGLGGGGGGAGGNVTYKDLTTANVRESTANLYFTNTRARAAFFAGSNITIAANGQISASGGGGGGADLSNYVTTTTLTTELTTIRNVDLADLETELNNIRDVDLSGLTATLAQAQSDLADLDVRLDNVGPVNLSNLAIALANVSPVYLGNLANALANIVPVNLGSLNNALANVSPVYLGNLASSLANILPVNLNTLNNALATVNITSLANFTNVINSIAANANAAARVTLVSSLATPGTANGQSVYNTTDGGLYIWNGTSWISPGASFTPTATSLASVEVWTTTPKPTSNLFTGRTILYTADSNLYIYVGGAWNSYNSYIQGSGTPTIAAGSITSAALGDGIVTARTMASGAVVAGTITAGAIRSTDIAAGNITSSLLAANSVIAGKIQAGVITAAEIAAGAITATQIAANAVTTLKIEAGAVTANSIQANAITSVHVSANSIYGNAIISNTIDARMIRANAITAIAIAAEAVYANAIQSNAIDARMIRANAITTLAIAANSIYGNAIISNTIDARMIRANAITAIAIAAEAVYANAIQSNAIDARMIRANAITALAIAADAVYANAIQAFAITAGKIAANAITAVTIDANAIYARNLTANSVTANAIAVNSIYANAIQAFAITSDKINANAITAGKIAANAIYANNISAFAITANAIQANAITAVHIGANVVTAAMIDSRGLAIRAADGTILFGSGAISSTVTVALPSGGTTTLGTIGTNSGIPPITFIGSYLSDSQANAGGATTNSVYKYSGESLGDGSRIKGSTYIKSSASLGGTFSLFVPVGASGTPGATGASGATGATGASGASGASGGSGASGTRGNLKVAKGVSGIRSWYDIYAQLAIETDLGVPLRVRDEVTLFASDNPSAFSETRFWTGTAWSSIAAFINGGLLVNGTISADKLVADSIDSAYIKAGAITAGKIGVGAITADKIQAGAITAAKITQSDAVTASGKFGFGQGITIGGYPGIVGSETTSVSSHGLLAGSTVEKLALAVGCNYAGFFAEIPAAGFYRFRNGTYTDTSSNKFTMSQLASSVSSYYGVSYYDITGTYNTITRLDSPNQGAVQATYFSSSGTGLSSARLAFNSYAAYIDLGTIGPFTGSHDAFLEKNTSYEIGDIVVDYELVSKPTVNDSITIVKLSFESKQKSVVGVISNIDNTHKPTSVSKFDPDSNTSVILSQYQSIVDSNDIIIINSLGEGCINVCGENGDIEIGDYITTSSMPGKGMKQDDDLMRNYTIAKSRENVTFASPTEVKMIACTYHAG